jgi:uncharacterized protein (DUF488 family)
MIDTVYSIGYSGFLLKEFINIIKANKIAVIVDVRSYPYSQRFPDYNKDTLEKNLDSNGIYYRNYAKEFGARQEDRKYYTKEGYLDFELFSMSKPFLEGFEKLIKIMEQNYTISLMCAEKDPINCHRTILVARALHDAGYKITHLLPNNITMTQEDIEKRLVDKYFPSRDQITLFGENLSESEYILKAYKKRNAEIGYTIEEENR